MSAMTVASDALARLDHGVGRPGDREIAAVLDRHVSWSATFCLVCGTDGQGKECDRCYLLRDVEVERGADV